MTGAPAATSEMDHLEQPGAKAFNGYLVHKDLVRTYFRHYPVPTYVVEFLLGRYCASTDPAEIEEGLQIVEEQLQGLTVHSGGRPPAEQAADRDPGDGPGFVAGRCRETRSAPPASSAVLEHLNLLAWDRSLNRWKKTESGTC
jgi:hypothetical protein